MSEKNGGPAFPSEAIWMGEDIKHTREQRNRGMSLRDYFAGQFAPFFIAHIYPPQPAKAWQEVAEWNIPQIAARVAYELADAMLGERDKNDE